MRNDNHGHFQLGLLGAWRLIRDGTTVCVPVRQQRLITALAIYGPRPRSYLRGLLWPDSPESRARESLRVSVHLVSRQVPGLLINGGEDLSLDGAVTVDLEHVRRRIRILLDGQSSTAVPADLEDLRTAVLLPGWYEDWIIFEQERLRTARLRACVVVAREAFVHSLYEQASAAAEAALELEPLYESAVRILILAERHLGNNGYALRVFQVYEARMREDLGARPSATVRGLIEDIT